VVVTPPPVPRPGSPAKLVLNRATDLHVLVLRRSRGRLLGGAGKAPFLLRHHGRAAEIHPDDEVYARRTDRRVPVVVPEPRPR
jgi:hypothetical protein